MKKHWLVAGVLALALVPSVALAFGYDQGQNVVIAEGQTKPGTFFAAGQTVEVRGTVDGDLVCAGNYVNITGTINGDVICAAQTIRVSGIVYGSVRAAGQTVEVGGDVGRNLMLFGDNVRTNSGTNIGGDVGLFGRIAELSGSMARDVYGAQQTLIVNGQVAGNVSAATDVLRLGDTAHIEGNVWYSGTAASTFDQSKVNGTVYFTEHPTQAQQHSNRGAKVAGWIYWTVAMWLTAVVLILAIPRGLRAVTTTMQRRPGLSFGWGALALFAAPMALVLLTFTIFGIPVMFALLLMWLIVMAFTPVWAGVSVGHWLLRKARWHADSLWWCAGVGVVVLLLAAHLPLFGPLVTVLALVWSLGGVMVTTVSIGRAKPKAVVGPAKSSATS
jgi:cytoskeletal protein CcmA (bactofilin family)